MANANTTGAPAPDQPQHPFVVLGDPEGTQHHIDAVLAFVQEYTQARAISIETYDDHPPDEKHLYGLIYILSACREAVTALGQMVVGTIEDMAP